MYKGFSGMVPTFTNRQIEFDLKNAAEEQRRSQELQFLQQVLDLFETDEITIEQILLTLEGFAQEGCVSMLEMEDKVRAIVFPLFKNSYVENIQYNLSRRLHDIVISWYKTRIASGDVAAEQELKDYQFMIGDALEFTDVEH